MIMKKFKDIVKTYDDFSAFDGASDDSIVKAEEKLGLRFNTEYKEFLKSYGTACANGHEFLGICDSMRLSIVEGTLNAKKKNSQVPDDLYLIEDVGIDKILIWQNHEGILFKTVGNGAPIALEIELNEYLED